MQEPLDFGAETPVPLADLIRFLGVPLLSLLSGVTIAVAAHQYGLHPLFTLLGSGH